MVSILTLMLFHFSLTSAGPGLNFIPVHSLLTDLQPCSHHLKHSPLCLELGSPLGKALPFHLLFHLGSDFTLQLLLDEQPVRFTKLVFSLKYF